MKLDSNLAQQPLRVKGDKVQLQQVILNLIVNGIDAIAETPNGVREIVCRSWASDGQALVSIRDTGPGIPSDRLERLFEPFFTTKQDGMGMGLCIAHTIIEAHGGKISAETRPSRWQQSRRTLKDGSSSPPLAPRRPRPYVFTFIRYFCFHMMIRACKVIFAVGMCTYEEQQAEPELAATETVGEVAYRHLRADIVFGRLAPGEKLRLDKVSQRYGTSVSTMRELLNRLGSEGMIVAKASAASRLRPCPPTASVRSRTCANCSNATPSGSRSQPAISIGKAASVAAHHKLAVMERRMIDGAGADPEAWKHCDWDFHHALVSACGSKLLMQTHAAIYDSPCATRWWL